MALSYGFNLDAPGKQYTSAQFSEAFHQVTADHVADYSGRFAIALSGGLSFSIAPGYLFVAGRWAKLNGSASYSLPIAAAVTDRYDALAAVVNLNTREVTLDVLSGVDPDNPPRSNTVYAVYLYTFHLGMSQTDLTPGDVTDHRQILISYSGVSTECDNIYRYFFQTFPAEVARIRAIGQDRIDAWPDEKAALVLSFKTARQFVTGDIVMSASRPAPNEDWLPCDGSTIPDENGALKTLLGTSTTPTITPQDERLTAWIYAATGFRNAAYGDYVEVDDSTPDIPTTTGGSTDVDPPPVVPPDDPTVAPEGAIATRAGEEIVTRAGEFITIRGADT